MGLAVHDLALGAPLCVGRRCDSFPTIPGGGLPRRVRGPLRRRRLRVLARETPTQAGRDRGRGDSPLEAIPDRVRTSQRGLPESPGEPANGAPTGSDRGALVDRLARL